MTAYALGCTDEGLRKELMDIEDSGVEIEGLVSLGGTGSTFKVHSFEVSILCQSCVASFIFFILLFSIMFCYAFTFLYQLL